jgi:hypothetical protein
LTSFSIPAPPYASWISDIAPKASCLKKTKDHLALHVYFGTQAKFKDSGCFKTPSLPHSELKKMWIFRKFSILQLQFLCGVALFLNTGTNNIPSKYIWDKMHFITFEWY